jgi:hypothetical protein
MRASVAAGSILAVLVLLAGCGSSSSGSHAIPFSIDDVKRAFARHGVRLQSGPTPSKSEHRLAVLTPASGVDTGVDLVFVDDSASFAKLSAASFNATPDAKDEQVGNVEVTFDPTHARAARASIASLRAGS